MFAASKFSDPAYALSKVVPVRFSTVHGVPDPAPATGFRWVRSTWWQWRGRIWGVRRQGASC
jgi:hypothetical protein